VALKVPNAIDLHCHYGPDTAGGDFSGLMTDYGVTAMEAVREAAASGYAALVLKSHSFASPALAGALDDAVPGIAVFGGICTDFPTGGLNVAAVEAALALGAKIVWLPTVHSSEDVSRGRRPYLAVPGIDVIGDDRRPVAAVREIADLVRAADAILATGHISAIEHYAVVKQFAGHTRVLITHAGEALAGPRLSAAQSAELADLGATVELTALSCQNVRGVPGKSPSEMAAMIATIGPHRCVLATDYGWGREVPRPAAGFRDFLTSLWERGVSESQIEAMASKNPARLLGVDV
jgi:Family of unknown function (DUF6282)